MVVGLRRFAIGLGVVALGALAAVWCADETVRLLAPRAIKAPLALPAHAEVRVSDGLVRLLGVGAGGALAVTVGHTIVVSSKYLALPRARQLRSMRHERVHVQQRERLGRRYLLVYLAQFVRYGYDRHPLEREARALSRARTARSGVQWETREGGRCRVAR